MKKDRAFYDTESTYYSAKRYPSKARTFTQFFFKRRLSLVLDLTSRILRDRSGISLLEIGCADGVVIQRIYARFKDSISSATGIDQSPSMIAAAQRANEHPAIQFRVREADQPLPEQQDLILEIGVLNYLDIDTELKAVGNALAKNGRYICSVSGRSASLNVFHPYGATFEHLRTYAEYEELFKERFDIESSAPVGLFVPLLWKLPFARPLQACVDALCSRLIPYLYLEKIYILHPRAI